jgi:hypothetical protein
VLQCCVKLIYLLPYSCDLNPIEDVGGGGGGFVFFAELKAFIKFFRSRLSPPGHRAYRVDKIRSRTE